MRRYLPLLVFSTVLAGAASTASTVSAGARVYVRIAPPVPLVEARIVAPGPAYVWVPGFHRWDGGAYVWVAGRWELPPAHHHAWVPGHWVHHEAHGWYWVEGHWRR